MGYHQTRHAGMRFHGPTLRQSDAYLVEIKNLIEQEIETGIGQRRITHSRTNALELFDVELLHREIFVRRIAPIGLAHSFMHTLCGSLCQTICQQLYHHLLISVVVEVFLHAHIHRSGEETYFRGEG